MNKMINYNEAFNSARLVPGAHKYISDWKKNAEEFRQAMLDLGLSVADSHTNFVLLKLADASQAQALQVGLRNQGYLVRPMRADLSDCLRITIGNKLVMQHLAKAIADLLAI